MKTIKGKIEKIVKKHDVDELHLVEKRIILKNKNIGTFNVQPNTFEENDSVSITLSDLDIIEKVEKELEEIHTLSDNQAKAGKSKGRIKGDPVISFE